MEPAITPQADAVAGPEASLVHLLGRLAVVEERVRAAVEGRRAMEPGPELGRGVFLSPQHIDRLLAVGPLVRPALTTPGGDGRAAAVPTSQTPGGDDPAAVTLAEVERRADMAGQAGARLRLRRLQHTFRLSALDVDILLVALAPEADARFEQLFAYLSDDVTRRRATVGLALQLSGAPMTSAAARQRLRPGAPLVDGGLLVVNEPEQPFLGRSLTVPDQVVMHLLGDDGLDPILARLRAWNPPCASGDPEALATALARGARLGYVRGPNGSAARALAAAAVDALGVPVLSLDIGRLGGDDPVHVARAAVRQARLQGGYLLMGPLDHVAESNPQAIRELADAGWPVVLFGSRSWDPDWSRTVPLLVEAPATTPEGRASLWRALLNGDCEADLDPAAETAAFRLGPDQIDRAAASAWLQAAYEGRRITGDDLRRGARAQNSAALERLGRRIEPRAGWDDLILPAPVTTRLRELLTQARWRERVLDGWGLGRTGRGGRGLTALFAGPSGTGKTLAAEVIAHELGLDLYTVDLAALVDKYIGETEKNLDRVFDEAERVNGVLFFDEADALFGNRSEVRDAHDRYANLEVAYLLQRLELFDGIAMLATNMRNNVDDAFTRRLDAILTFPFPDQADRRRLWERFLGTGAPLDPDLDIAACAKVFELAGGSIRNVCLAAAYFAADRGDPIQMPDILLGVQREYEKLGRLLSHEEFGPFADIFEPA